MWNTFNLASTMKAMEAKGYDSFSPPFKMCRYVFQVWSVDENAGVRPQQEDLGQESAAAPLLWRPGQEGSPCKAWPISDQDSQITDNGVDAVPASILDKNRLQAWPVSDQDIPRLYPFVLFSCLASFCLNLLMKLAVYAAWWRSPDLPYTLVHCCLIIELPTLFWLNNRLPTWMFIV